MSVPMKAYVDARTRGLLWVGITAALGFAAVILTLDRKNGEAVKLALEGQEEATKVALAAAAEKGLHHNGLIDRMREMAGTYVTRGNVYSLIIGAAAVAGIYFGFSR